jgi:monothiol glutaredoxin
MSDILNQIKTEVESNDVVLYMKGVPTMPMCGFSNVVSQVLANCKVEFKGVNVLENEEVRSGIKEFSNWPTIPQLYVKGEFIGGCDIVREMYESGELQKLFEEKKVTTKV